MGLSSTVNRSNHVGSGATATYSYGFKIFDDDDLTVIVRDADGAETVLTKTTHYTVTGVGEQAGGTIVLVNGSFDWIDSSGFLESGFDLAIIRIVDIVQNTDIRNQGSYFPETHEDVFDYLTMIDQQQQDSIDRSVHLADSIDPDDFDTELPSDIADSAGEAVIVNSSGDGFSTTPLSSFGVIAKATQAEAEAGAENVAYMTSLRTKQQVDARLIGQAAAEAGTDNTLLMTALRSYQQFLVLGAKHNLVPYNMGFSTSVGSSALTIALKQADGTTDPTSALPVIIPFRSATSTSGAINHRQVTAALSMVISSGSTLGHVSAKTEYIFIYAIDNAGTVELAVSSALYNDGSIVSTTAEGGAGAADSATAIYSTTARSNVPLKLLKQLKSSQATAGTWATAIAEISSMAARRYTLGSQQFFTSSGTWTRPDGCLAVRVTCIGSGGGGGGADGGGGTGASSGMGGGGGEFSQSFLVSGFGATETITVGAAGAAGAASGGGDGGLGGTSSFGSLVTAIGGSGGDGDAAPSTSDGRTGTSGGVGGTGGVGQLKIPGQAGDIGIALGVAETSISGKGGASGSGFGWNATRGGNAAGTNGQGYGGGGNGATVEASATDRAGGTGATGIVIVEEFY